MAEQTPDLRRRQAGIRRLTPRAAGPVEGSARIQERDGLSGVHLKDARIFPTAEDLVGYSAATQPTLALAKRQLVNAIEVEGVGLIEISPRIIQLMASIIEERINQRL